jgi:transcription initiation factor IIE alpha subunit
LDETKMTDDDLAKGLCLTPTESAIVIPRLSASQRVAYERMIEFADAWNLYAAGFGPRPTGAIVCHEHRKAKL